MDWARDKTGLSGKDLDNVFKYEEKSTTVVRMLSDEKVDSRDVYCDSKCLQPHRNLWSGH